MYIYTFTAECFVRPTGTLRFLDGEDSDVLCAVVASTALGPRATLATPLAFGEFQAPTGACGYLCAVVASTALGPRARLTAALAFEIFEAPIGAGGRRRLRCGYLGAVVASAALGLRARQRAPLALEELDAPICARWRRWHRRHRRRHRRRHQWRRLWRRHKALRTTRAVLEAASMQPRLRCKPRCRFVCMAPMPTADIEGPYLPS